ncbi:hypothetical protein VNO77_00246 [Canavalia gladiata]|uniref:Secreted protein n=1 Tax=Canavalia gladiata TaxID=3824 RepID=A0AAN9MP90_CANGL
MTLIICFKFLLLASHFLTSLFSPPSPMASQSQVQTNLTVSISSLPKGHCLCSPTTHEGSFRCRLHRSVTASTSSSSTPAWMKRSKTTMPSNKPVLSVSPQ